MNPADPTPAEHPQTVEGRPDVYREALQRIIDFQPERERPTDEQFAESAACPDCQYAAKINWPPSRTCSTHYSMFRQVERRNEDRERYQHAELRKIAREALAR